MKNFKNYPFLIIICMLVTGCMSAFTKFWNNGSPMSEKEREAYHYCRKNTDRSINYDDFYNCLKKKVIDKI